MCVWLVNIYTSMQLSRTYTQNITLYLPDLSLPQPLTVECRRGRLVGSCINILTYREPSAFQLNTKYTTRGHGRGHGRGRGRGCVCGDSSYILSRGSSA